MPLGDSLTWGYDGLGADPTRLATLNTGGYRTPLYSDLTAPTSPLTLDGVGVNYVGVNTGNPSTILSNAHETAHNGFNGYRIDQIDNNISASSPADVTTNLGGFWLSGGGGTGRGPQTANVILLQIGANDITQGYDPSFAGNAATETDAQFAADETTRLQTLITHIQTLEPNATLLVDGTSPLLNGASDTNRSYDYDLDVQSLVANSYQNKNVYYVDMWDAIYHGALPGYEYYANDGIHLNSLGYAAMAQAWDSAILNDVNISEAEAIPEPSSLALFALGAAGLYGWRGLRRKSVSNV